MMIVITGKVNVMGEREMNTLALARAYDTHSDRLLEETQERHYRYLLALSSFTDNAKIPNTWEFDELNEALCIDELFWLAIGSGDYAKVEEIKRNTIEKIVEKQLQ